MQFYASSFALFLGGKTIKNLMYTLLSLHLAVDADSVSEAPDIDTDRYSLRALITSVWLHFLWDVYKYG